MYNQNFKILALYCDCTGRFVSDLVGNPEDRFSRVAAHSIKQGQLQYLEHFFLFFCQIRPQTMKLAALEHFEKFNIMG